MYAERIAGLKSSAIREILKTTSSPDVISFAGYAGISSRNGWGDPSVFKSQSINGNASLSKVWGKHTIVTGYQYDHLYLLAAHGSCCSRGVFDFNGQYTGNAFADYLLGYAIAYSESAVQGIGHWNSKS